MTHGSALIGHTGFVGSNLDRQMRFQHRFRSTDIETIAGKCFDLVICAGVSAVKWLANQDPERDRAGIGRLIGPLQRVQAERFVLISTVDVYPDPHAVDEASAIDAARLAPYGRHRYELEQFVTAHFPRVLVLRLPGLFGPGLKKNVIYDLLHGNRLEKINPASAFQYYPLARLARDIEAGLTANLNLANLSTEPLPTAQIHAALFAGTTIGANADQPLSYDMRTRHAEVFGGSGAYVMTAADVLTALDGFVVETRHG